MTKNDSFMMNNTEFSATLPITYSSTGNNNSQHKIYNVSGYDQSKLPEWILEKHKKSLRKDANYSKRIQLIQDFDFPEASNRIQLTPDQKYIVSTGTYKPQIRVYDLEQLCLKFERNTDAENIQFRILDQDWTKLVLLQADRSLELHTQGGIYYRVKIPKFGRDLVYDPITCDVVSVGSSNEAFRLNLDQGRFLKSWETQLEEINSIRIDTRHRLYAIGGKHVEYWDPRHRKQVGGINIPNGIVTSIEFLQNSYMVCIGTNSGFIYLYDLRSNSPIQSKSHQYEYPIISLDYDPKQRSVISVDQKIIKVWDSISGDTIANVEPSQKINDFCRQHDTGFFMTANESSQMQSFYMPLLGPAPKWCQHLEHITEELEENPHPIVYDHFKFVTRKELEQLGLGHLVGTDVLRAYMHGFFIDQRLYEKAKSITSPFAYESYRQEQIKNKMMREQESRIRTDPKSLVRANKELAKLWKQMGRNVDDRFSELFSNPDFERENTRKVKIVEKEKDYSE